MFDEVGRKYDLDYVVFGPSGFQFEREHTFSFMIRSKKDKFVLHARYILDGEELKIIKVIGDDYVQRSENYFRFIPHMQYLKYDCYAPMFLSCLVSPEKNLWNPFYYYKDGLSREIMLIYEKLLLALVKTKKEIVLIEYYWGITPLAEQLNKEHLHGAKIFRMRRFPYQAILGHNSPLGNMILAQQVFDFLVNNSVSNIGLLKIIDNNHLSPSKGISLIIKPDSWENICIEIEGKRIGVFADLGAQKKSSRKSSSSFFTNNAKSLISFTFDGQSMLNGCFLSVEFEFRNNNNIELEIRRNFSVQHYDLGTIKLLVPELAIAGFETKKFRLEEDGDKIIIRLTEQLQKMIGSIGGGGAVSLLLDGKMICNGRFLGKGETIELVPPKHKFKVSRAIGTALLDFDSLPDEGNVNIVCKSIKGEKNIIKFAKYKKEHKKISFNQKKDKNIFQTKFRRNFN